MELPCLKTVFALPKMVPLTGTNGNKMIKKKVFPRFRVPRSRAVCMGCSSSNASEGPHRYAPPAKFKLLNPKRGRSASRNFDAGYQAGNGYLDARYCHAFPPDAANSGNAWYEIRLDEAKLLGGIIFQNGPNLDDGHLACPNQVEICVDGVKVGDFVAFPACPRENSYSQPVIFPVARLGRIVRIIMRTWTGHGGRWGECVMMRMGLLECIPEPPAPPKSVTEEVELERQGSDQKHGFTGRLKELRSAHHVDW